MQAKTSGTFRVLETPHPGSETYTLLDRSDLEPTLVDPTDYEGDLAERISGLRPGYLVDADLSWTNGSARFNSVEVLSYTLFEYVQGVSGLFEAALETMEAARRDGAGVTGRPTFSTDGEPNGAVYAFAEQRGERDVFEDVRVGRLPLEPLIDRLEDGAVDAAAPGEGLDAAPGADRAEAADGDGPHDHEVFVMRPVDHDYVVVYLVDRRDTLLADTVRDTYDCPRPDEPLRD